MDCVRFYQIKLPASDHMKILVEEKDLHKDPQAVASDKTMRAVLAITLLLLVIPFFF